MTNLLGILFCSGLIYLIGTPLIARLSIARRISVYFRIALLGLTSLPLIWWLRNEVSGFDLYFILFDSISHLSIGVLFAHFICLPDRALTLRLLVELNEAGEKGLEISELNARFSLARMIESRLSQMEKGGLLSIDSQGRIRLLEKGQFIGDAIWRGRRFYRITSAN